MANKIALALLAVAGLTLGACGPSEPPKPPGAATPTPPTLVEKAMQAARETGQAAEAQLRTATGGMWEKGKGLTETALDKGKGLTDATGAKAVLLIPQIKDAIAANRPELARNLMARLESIKGALPEPLKPEVDRLAALLAGTQQSRIPAAAPAATPRPVSAVHPTDASAP